MIELVLAGVNALRDYIATHVLTCLVPAFPLAVGIVAFVSREVILDYLANKPASYVVFHWRPSPASRWRLVRAL